MDLTLSQNVGIDVPVDLDLKVLAQEETDNQFKVVIGFTAPARSPLTIEEGKVEPGAKFLSVSDTVYSVLLGVCRVGDKISGAGLPLGLAIAGPSNEAGRAGFYLSGGPEDFAGTETQTIVIEGDGADINLVEISVSTINYDGQTLVFTPSFKSYSGNGVLENDIPVPSAEYNLSLLMEKARVPKPSPEQIKAAVDAMAAEASPPAPPAEPPPEIPPVVETSTEVPPAVETSTEVPPAENEPPAPTGFGGRRK